MAEYWRNLLRSVLKIKDNIQLSQSSANPLGWVKNFSCGTNAGNPDGQDRLIVPTWWANRSTIRFNLRMSARGAGCLIKVPIITDTFVGRSVAWWRRSWADFIWFRWDIISPTLTVKHASGDPSTFCWTPLAQTPYLSRAQLNRPLAELGHAFLYHLATSRWMASHPSVHSDHKAFSPFKRSILSFKYSVKKLTEMTGLEALKDVWINLEAFCSVLCKHLTSDQVLQRAFPGLVIPTQNFPQAKTVVCKGMRVNTFAIMLSLAFG